MIRFGWAMLLLALVLPALTLPAAPTRAAERTCMIGDLAALGRCFGHAPAYSRFVFTADLRCTTAATCCPGGRSPMRLQNLSGRVIEGGGHVFRREAGQRACPALVLRHVERVALRDLVFDEDGRAPPCELAAKHCAATLDISLARAVTLEDVRVFGGKGYAVRVWNSADFTFDRSAVIGAGIIGLYVGHYRFGPTRGVRITDSVFADNRTNGIALQGVLPDQRGADGRSWPVLVQGNVLVDNHWHGLWPIPGGVTTGGQLLVADGSDIVVRDNIFSGHPCGNCFRSRHVAAVEIAEPGGAPGVAGLAIRDNVALGIDETAAAFHVNVGARVSGLEISGNRVEGFPYVDDSRGLARGTGNRATAGGLGTNTRREAQAAAPALRRQPLPGEPVVPVLLCAGPAGRFRSTAHDCGAAGQVVAVLGFR